MKEIEIFKGSFGNSKYQNIIVQICLSIQIIIIRLIKF